VLGKPQIFQFSRTMDCWQDSSKSSTQTLIKLWTALKTKTTQLIFRAEPDNKHIHWCDFQITLRHKSC